MAKETSNHYGVGFIGVHDGRGAAFVFVDFWGNENELFHRVFLSREKQPDKLSAATPEDSSVCVWDLQFQAFERDAWVKHVLRKPETPDLDGYLSEHFAGGSLISGPMSAGNSGMRSRSRILHVDDDPDIRLLISASLQDFGYFVATAGTNAEALELVKRFKFDLCILDVRLPDGTGIELCQRIHTLQPKIPTLYYSAYASDEEQEAALSVCGHAYLKKPVSIERLQQSISGLLCQACA